MAGKRPRLTAALQEQICSYIRAGGYPHVAAEAAGVPKEVFEEWLQRGSKPGARGAYWALAAAVSQAQAQARLKAETAVNKSKAVDWLKCGPGKETAEQPGWSTAPRPRSAQPGEGGAQVSLSELLELCRLLLDALAPYPEAREAAAAVLAGKLGPAPTEESP
jgi:hypothetical protein